MMQGQIMETFASNSKGETSVSTEAHKTEMHMIIDFDNIEDILDFGAHSSPKAVNDNEDLKKRPPRLHRRIAQDPVKLLDLKPMIDKFVNDVQRDSEDDEADHEAELKSKRRFQCIVCGMKFIRSSHLHRHMRLHTGSRPYACHICGKRFSRGDYKAAHVNSHYTNKIHCCCVCGEVYLNLTQFADHCRTHDDSEYMRIEISRAAEKSKVDFKRQILIAKDPVLVTAVAEEILLSSCVTIEKIDNSTAEECIVCIENPIYNIHQAAAINSILAQPIVLA